MADSPGFGSFSRQMVGYLTRLLSEIGHEYGVEMTVIVVKLEKPAERFVVTNTTWERAASQIRGLAGCAEADDFVFVPGHQEPN